MYQVKGVTEISDCGSNVGATNVTGPRYRGYAAAAPREGANAPLAHPQSDGQLIQRVI